MFWNRKESITHGDLGPLSIPPQPASPEFETMLELLRDAEKYNNAGQKQVSDAILADLCEFINTYFETK